ncbi:MAG: DUF4058 family protein [Prochloron sp. SP5CPC1]|nr:DUF4058 family protein [Candidatus Paraprochloron terpiosi SP5CPC1]
MPSPFPEIHHRLIVAIADAMNPQLRPRYRIGMEERVYIRDEVELNTVGWVERQRNPTWIGAVGFRTSTQPTLAEDKEPIINLQDLLHLAYDRGSYDLMIVYQREAVPALSPTDRVWVDGILEPQMNADERRWDELDD